jgi:hypothetical protein
MMYSGRAPERTGAGANPCGVRMQPPRPPPTATRHISHVLEISSEPRERSAREPNMRQGKSRGPAEQIGNHLERPHFKAGRARELARAPA